MGGAGQSPGPSSTPARGAGTPQPSLGPQIHSQPMDPNPQQAMQSPVANPFYGQHSQTMAPQDPAMLSVQYHEDPSGLLKKKRMTHDLFVVGGNTRIYMNTIQNDSNHIVGGGGTVSFSAWGNSYSWDFSHTFAISCCLFV